MDWLQDLPWQVFWFGWAMVALLAGGSLYAVWWARRNVQAIATQTPVDVTDLRPGYRLAWGRTVGPDIAAPLTGRPCVWWKVQVWESVKETGSGSTSDSTRWTWREIMATESDRPLLFGDGAAVAAVWTSGATATIPSGWSDWRGTSLPPEDRTPKLRTGGVPGQGVRHDSQGTFGPRYRYVEQIIKSDAPIFVLGAVTRTDPARYAAADDDEEEEPLRDGDDAVAGSLADSGAETDESDAFSDGAWPAARKRLGIVPTPDRVIAADMARAAWTIGAARGRPFLISTDHPEAVSAEQELGAKGGMIMGGIFTALALFLVWARYLA
jgi:hypothetical protein